MEAVALKIYSAEITPRLQFIADFILKEILGLSWEIVTDRRKLGKHPVINYSGKKLPGTFNINPVGLLFETGVNSQEIRVEYWRELPVFFQSSDNSDLPFDIFAASFFLVTRYEEYYNSETDRYGRFPSDCSVASKYGFLGIPVIDLWARELARSLVKKYQNITIRSIEFKAIVTFDVDEPFEYLGKTVIGNIGGIFSDIRSGSGKISLRLGTLRGEKKDPYAVFDYMIQACERNNSEVLFFFPVGNRSEYENNPSWKNEQYRDLINNLADKFVIGLHPSYKASGNNSLIKMELARINAILKMKCSLSRFHFLKISMPISFRNLNDAGIREDYSMGYPDESGYRAGTGRPFRFYDLHNEIITDLRIYPFQVMDVTLRDYKKLNAADAKKVIGQLIDQTRKAGGIFTSIWHNTSLLDTPECREWRDVFEFTLQEQMA